MTTKQEISKIQEIVLKRVTGLDVEDLFWMRIELADDYLMQMIRDETEHKRIRSKKVFWEWFNRILNTCELRTIDYMDQHKFDTVNDVWYKFNVGYYMRDFMHYPPKFITARDKKTTRKLKKQAV